MNETKTFNLALTGLMTALICIFGPFSIHIPISPVPLSFCSMAIYFVITVCGLKKGTISVLAYLMLGFLGVPVFTGFSGGAGKLMGPTGGYLIGYIFLAIISGFFIEKFENNLSMHILGLILGTFILYAFGSVWLAISAGMDLKAALLVGSIPYIPGDIAKMGIAFVFGNAIKKQMKKAGYYHPAE